jgi:threonine dehydratase
VLVDDDEIAAAIRAYWTDTHNLAEGAGAAPLAAAFNERGRLAGKTVGLILSGGNIDLELFQRWAAPAARPAPTPPEFAPETTRRHEGMMS